MYEYEKQLKSDIHNELDENFTHEEILQMKTDYKLYNKAYDLLFISDNVTGNASGSYFCNHWKAKNQISKDIDILCDILIEHNDVINYMIRGDWESVDVLIRCHMLGMVLNEYIDNYE